jgi:ribosomal subunit interface protein
VHIDMSGRGLELTDPIKSHVEDRLVAALDQHAQDVQRVDAVLEDTNGPKGGADKLVKVHVHFTDGSTLRIEQKGEDLYATISQAADAVKQNAGRQRDRQRRG